MSNDFQSGSRSGYRAKRKKTNLILNSLIVIVLALIFFVAYTIFLSGDDKASQNEEQTKSAANESSEKEDKNTEDKTAVKESEKNTDSEKTDSEKTDSEESADEESEEASSPEQEDDSQAVITEGDGSSNVLRTIENPAWKPVGTVQTGEHAPVYDSSSVDWQEMLTAISYATGLEESNMTVYWLGRDKTSGNGTFSTVASKDKSQKYNVYLEWVDGQGWKPTKVEELTAIQ
ncbi:YrrS family protein [Neobacillus sp. 179-C4.2 HS]|uniref:YrrS family protein n=1 Tax=Neobacillus driksii TaxID=3035913 RepID=A0ABV4YLW4_9BACI|nr:YrrS family protein [Neobacillus sp. 179.-C4.2 HS]MDP5193142.1 YrrS family protein [Neobacillus sp. 179.-C4.2 HS]